MLQKQPVSRPKTDLTKTPDKNLSKATFEHQKLPTKTLSKTFAYLHYPYFFRFYPTPIYFTLFFFFHAKVKKNTDNTDKSLYPIDKQ
jgi:hypothetical protein